MFWLTLIQYTLICQHNMAECFIVWRLFSKPHKRCRQETVFYCFSCPGRLTFPPDSLDGVLNKTTTKVGLLSSRFRSTIDRSERANNPKTRRLCLWKHDGERRKDITPKGEPFQQKLLWNHNFKVVSRSHKLCVRRIEKGIDIGVQPHWTDLICMHACHAR